MKYLKFSLIALIPFILWGCPDRDIPFDSTVIFINNSDKTLLDYCRDNYYPDTTIQVEGNVFDDRIKKFIGKTVGRIVSQLYSIVKDEAQRLGMYTYELRYGSKPYKIFMCEEFTFQKENSLKKEIIVSLINADEDDEFIKFVKQIEPLPFDDVPHEYVKYLINPQSNLSLTEELESIYEDNFDKERMSMVEIIGNSNVSFGEEDDNEDLF